MSRPRSASKSVRSQLRDGGTELRPHFRPNLGEAEICGAERRWQQLRNGRFRDLAQIAVAGKYAYVGLCNLSCLENHLAAAPTRRDQLRAVLGRGEFVANNRYRLYLLVARRIRRRGCCNLGADSDAVRGILKVGAGVRLCGPRTNRSADSET